MTEPAPHRKSRVTWSHHGSTTWIAQSKDGIEGLIEQNDLGYRLTDSDGDYLGFFVDLAEAQAALGSPGLWHGTGVFNRQPRASRSFVRRTPH